MALRRFDDTAASGTHAYDILKVAIGPDHRRTKDQAAMLGDLYLAMGKAEETEICRGRAAGSVGQ